MTSLDGETGVRPWFAEVGGRIVGCVTFVDGLKALSEVDDPDAATVRMLGVATEARGRGVGEALMRECIDRARRSERKRVRLDTRTSMTSAQRLYERLGFRRDPDHDWSPLRASCCSAMSSTCSCSAAVQ